MQLRIMAGGLWLYELLILIILADVESKVDWTDAIHSSIHLTATAL